MKTVKTIAVWVATVLCALMFVFAGTMGLVNYEGKASEGMAKFGYPDWFRILIGVLELAGGLLLLLPRFAWIGSSTLVVIMIGKASSAHRNWRAMCSLGRTSRRCD